MRPIAPGAPLSPGFFVSANGSDSNVGTKTAPFLSFSKCATAMASAPSNKKRTYILDEGDEFTPASAWAMASNQTWQAFPGQAPIIIMGAIENSGGITLSNVSILGALTIIGSANDGGAVFQFDNPTNLVVQECTGLVAAWEQWLEIYNPNGAVTFQGNYLRGPTIGPTSMNGVFMFNAILNDGLAHANFIIGSNTSFGGTLAYQIQVQGTHGIWTNFHYDWNIATGWGSNVSIIGNEGVSWVGSANQSNINNTCTGNTLIGAYGVNSLGVEAQLAGCTYNLNEINAPYGFALSACYNSLFANNNITSSAMPFSNDGSGWTAPVAPTVEIGTNTINGSPVTGAGTPTNLVPLPSGSGLPTYTPSAPYTNNPWVSILNAAIFNLNGVSWQALNFNTSGATPYSLTNISKQYRFRVLNGQNYSDPPIYSDPAWVMRSEVYASGFPFNTNITFSFKLIVGWGPVTTNNWFIVGQIHADNNVTGASPPFAFDIQPDGSGGEKLQFDLNYQQTGQPVTYTNIGSVPFKRNTLYNIQLVFRDAQGANTGYAQVTINGVVAVTYNGFTGYYTAVAQSYPKWGVYSGGNGSSATATPIAGQDLLAIYINPTYTP